MKRGNRVTQNLRTSAALSAVGRRAKKTNGSALAASNGTHSTPEASARPACTSGPKPSASLAAVGRPTRSGMGNEPMARTLESF